MQAVYKYVSGPYAVISDLRGPCPTNDLPPFPKNIHAKNKTVLSPTHMSSRRELHLRENLSVSEAFSDLSPSCLIYLDQLKNLLKRGSWIWQRTLDWADIVI